jgi:hypothetical protein
MDHRYLRAEKFPTFASGRKGSGPVTLLGIGTQLDISEGLVLLCVIVEVMTPT